MRRVIIPKERMPGQPSHHCQYPETTQTIPAGERMPGKAFCSQKPQSRATRVVILKASA